MLGARQLSLGISVPRISNGLSAQQTPARRLSETPHLNCPHFDHSSRAFYVPLRHIWAGTNGHSVGHSALRCTTAFSGVWSLAPPLRLRGRTGVFHRRAAPPHSPTPGHPLLRVLAHSFLRPPGFALSGRGRLPQSVAFPSSRTTPLAQRHLVCLLGPRAGSPPWRHRSPFGVVQG